MAEKEEGHEPAGDEPEPVGTGSDPAESHDSGGIPPESLKFASAALEHVKRMAAFGATPDILRRYQTAIVPRMPAYTVPKLDNPQLETLLEVREEIRALAEISRATGEQIAAMATLTGATVEELQESRTSADQAAATITRLTWALVGLTVILVILTGALILKPGG